MKKEKFFDALIIIASGILMMIVVWLGVEGYYVQFSVIPLIIFYFLGKYSQRKFGATSNIKKF